VVPLVGARVRPKPRAAPSRRVAVVHFVAPASPWLGHAVRDADERQLDDSTCLPARQFEAAGGEDDGA
jgi:hypothetical protein